MNTDKKVCGNPNCKYSKPGELMDIKSFYKANNRCDGYDSYCKGCRVEKNRACVIKDVTRAANWDFGSRGHREKGVERQHGKKFAWQKEDDRIMKDRKVDKRNRLRTKEERHRLSKALIGNINAKGKRRTIKRLQTPEEKYKKKIAMLKFWNKRRRLEGRPERPIRGITARKAAAPRVFDYNTNTWRNNLDSGRIDGERI